MLSDSLEFFNTDDVIFTYANRSAVIALVPVTDDVTALSDFWNLDPIQGSEGSLSNASSILAIVAQTIIFLAINFISHKFLRKKSNDAAVCDTEVKNNSNNKKSNGHARTQDNKNDNVCVEICEIHTTSFKQNRHCPRKVHWICKKTPKRQKIPRNLVSNHHIKRVKRVKSTTKPVNNSKVSQTVSRQKNQVRKFEALFSRFRPVHGEKRDRRHCDVSTSLSKYEDAPDFEETSICFLSCSEDDCSSESSCCSRSESDD